MNTLNDINKRLDDTIRRYYRWRIVRGLLIWAIVLFVPWMLLAMGAFYTWIGSGMRLMLLVLYVLLNLTAVGLWVLVPWLRLNGGLLRMTRREAALRIGAHFPEIQDKLLNTVELQDLAVGSGSLDLVGASLEQRNGWLKPFSFGAIVPWSKLKPYAWAVVPLVVLWVVLWVWVPSVMSVGTERILRYDVGYTLPAPFDFDANGTPLRIEAGSDWDVQLQTKGHELPKEAFVHWNGHAYKMRRISAGRFAFKVPNVRRSSSFWFSASGFRSSEENLAVFHNPTLLQLELHIEYPAHTGKAAERLLNSGDVQIPRGSALRFVMDSKHASGFGLVPSGESPIMRAAAVQGNGTGQRHALRWVPGQSGPYALVLYSDQGQNPDTLSFGVELVDDAPPDLEVEVLSPDQNPENKPSQSQLLAAEPPVLSGRAWDDYGLRALRFIYWVKPAGQTEFESQTRIRELPWEGGMAEKQFEFLLDPSDLGLGPGDGVRYGVEVEDNDQPGGYKRTRSALFEWRVASEREKEQALETLSRETATGFQKADKDMQEAQKQARKLSDRLKQQKEWGFEDRKDLEKLRNEQRQAIEEVEELQKKLELQQQNQSSETPSQILEKQEKIKEMAERLLNEEMKEMLRNIEKMLRDEANKPEIQKQLEKLEKDQSKVSKELDRMLQFFKELEVEDRIEKAMKKLEEMARKQEDLASQTKLADQDLNKAAEEQETLRKETESLLKEWEKTKEKNKELERPKDLDGLEEQGEEVTKDQEEAENQAKNQQNRSKASQKQQKAAAGMRQMSSRMQEQLAQQEMEELEEDLKAMRRLLGRVLKFSFDQEHIMERLKDQTGYSQVFVQLSREQFALREQMDPIKDSLEALSRRVWQIQAPVQKEIKELEEQYKATLERMSQRDIGGAKGRQQYTMTAANNLANLLSELLQQATEQKASQMPGNQQCKKPKPGGSGMSRLRSMQKKLSDQMQEQQGKSKGPGKGESKSGQKPNRGEGGKEFAQMVAQQEAIRREMEKILKEMNKEGGQQPGRQAVEDAVKQMQQSEKELVNKQMTSESLQRQQQILSRMLEAEKAEQEREMEQSRSSESARQQASDAYKTNQEKALQAKKQIQGLYKPAGPDLNAFYRERNLRYQTKLRQNPPKP